MRLSEDAGEQPLLNEVARNHVEIEDGFGRGCAHKVIIVSVFREEDRPPFQFPEISRHLKQIALFRV